MHRHEYNRTCGQRETGLTLSLNPVGSEFKTSVAAFVCKHTQTNNFMPGDESGSMKENKQRPESTGMKTL